MKYQVFMLSVLSFVLVIMLSGIASAYTMGAITSGPPDIEVFGHQVFEDIFYVGSREALPFFTEWYDAVFCAKTTPDMILDILSNKGTVGYFSIGHGSRYGAYFWSDDFDADHDVFLHVSKIFKVMQTRNPVRLSILSHCNALSGDTYGNDCWAGVLTKGDFENCVVFGCDEPCYYTYFTMNFFLEGLADGMTTGEAASYARCFPGGTQMRLVGNPDLTLSDLLSPLPYDPVTVVSPHGGETFIWGDTIDIEWLCPGVCIMNASLFKGVHQVAMISPLIQGDRNGSLSWIIPSSIDGCEDGFDYSIRIMDTQMNYDFSNNFAITSNPVQNHVSVVSPNGGELVFKGDSYIIEWVSKGVGLVGCELWKGDSLFSVLNPVLQDMSGSWRWDIDESSSIPKGNDYRIRIVDQFDSYDDYSDDYFTIDEKAPYVPSNGSICVLFPNGGEELSIGKTYVIEWITCGDVGPVIDIDLVDGDNEKAYRIFTGDSGNGSYEWTISGLISSSSSYQIRVTDEYGNSDYSDGYFSIKKPGDPVPPVPPPPSNDIVYLSILSVVTVSIIALIYIFLKKR